MTGKKNLRFGLVGCGYIGERHASLILIFGELRFVCDIDPIRAKLFSDKYQCHGLTDYVEMLKNANKLDVIVVCTPNWLHAQQSILALECGLHVICEKPMALKISDAEQMIDAAKRNQRILWIVKQNRYNSPLVYLKRMVENGKLGKIFSISLQGFWNRNLDYYARSNWKGKIEMDGGMLFTQFSHFLDAGCWILGEMECIKAMGSNFAHNGIIEFDDTITGVVKFSHDIIGCLHFSINAFEQNMEGSFTVLGEKGSITIGGPYLNKLSYHKVEGLIEPKLEKENPENDYGYYKGSMNNHKMVYQHFIQSLSEGKPMDSELETSLQTMKAIHSVLQALTK